MDWLQRLEHSEIVVVNLRPDTEVETEFVSFDRLRVPERIAADLDDLNRLPDDAHAGKESNPQDARARHRHELAPAATRAEDVKSPRAALAFTAAAAHERKTFFGNESSTVAYDVTYHPTRTS